MIKIMDHPTSFLEQLIYFRNLLNILEQLEKTFFYRFLELIPVIKELKVLKKDIQDILDLEDNKKKHWPLHIDPDSRSALSEQIVRLSQSPLLQFLAYFFLAFGELNTHLKTAAEHLSPILLKSHEDLENEKDLLDKQARSQKERKPYEFVYGEQFAIKNKVNIKSTAALEPVRDFHDKENHHEQSSKKPYSHPPAEVIDKKLKELRNPSSISNFEPEAQEKPKKPLSVEIRSPEQDKNLQSMSRASRIDQQLQKMRESPKPKLPVIVQQDKLRGP